MWVRFSFGIPCGNDGPQGQPGNNGSDGQPGPQGPPSRTSPSTPNTLQPWENAYVQANYDGTFVRFTFGIPRRPDGMQGPQGQPGPEGLPFTNFTVDATNTLQRWECAYVTTAYDGTFVRFPFGIPRGQDGMTGPKRPAGKATSEQLAAAIPTPRQIRMRSPRWRFRSSTLRCRASWSRCLGR